MRDLWRKMGKGKNIHQQGVPKGLAGPLAGQGSLGGFHSPPFSLVTIQQGVPRGLAGPLAGCGVSPPFSLTPPPQAVQEKRDLKNYKIFYPLISGNRETKGNTTTHTPSTHSQY